MEISGRGSWADLAIGRRIRDVPQEVFERKESTCRLVCGIAWNGDSKDPIPAVFVRSC